MNLTIYDIAPNLASKQYVLKQSCIEYLEKTCKINQLEWFVAIAIFLLIWQVFILDENMSWKQLVPIGVLIIWIISALTKIYLL